MTTQNGKICLVIAHKFWRTTVRPIDGKFLCTFHHTPKTIDHILNDQFLRKSVWKDLLNYVKMMQALSSKRKKCINL